MSSNRSQASLQLSPIDRPRSWLVRLFNWFMRRRMGKAMMPARVIYARFPGLLWASLPFYYLLDRGLSLPPALLHLVEVRVSALNGCTFCVDIHRADAQQRGHASTEKLEAAALGLDSPAFSQEERAALDYVGEIARTGAAEQSFPALRALFGERAIIELTWLQAYTTYLNRLARPLGIGSDNFCALRQPTATRTLGA